VSQTRLLLMHCLSPLHAGTGQGVGLIDLPIAREKSTNLPCLPGSSLKGALRARCEDEALRKMVFGPDTSRADEHSGSAHFSDMTLLFLPVRSVYGTFAWATSPYVLRRLARDLGDLGLQGAPARVPGLDTTADALVAGEGSRLLSSAESMVILEDLDLKARPSKEVGEWAAWLGLRLFPETLPQSAEWRAALNSQMVLLHDDTFSYLLETATDVTARIRIDEKTRTVADGALWYEESLPVESVLWGVLVASAVAQGRNGDKSSPATVLQSLERLTDGLVQLGGNATVGRGMARLQMVEG
jgi:CRISPR-associated protein Cmr4